ncbi:hypothetical protein NE237_019357 [Protea cynaroides]|uniref:Sulfotransferase n=1 Tax=Protea cynaroides TaxID=273540 RepID=A0A9Q0KBJ8_9MAGN|nr:hypothetical protein NE237_019357 [Protea cynaroides]
MAYSYTFSNCFVTKTREEEEKNERSLQRYKQLVSNLPKEDGSSFKDHIRLYQGFWYEEVHCQAVLAIQDHFKARSTDTIIATNPKSGATWIKALVFAIVNRSKYPIYNHPLLSENPHGLMPFMEISLYNNRIPDLEIIPSPRIFSTRISYTSLPQSMIDSGSRIVYISRNPKDAFVSFWHFKNKMRAVLSKPPLTFMEDFENFGEEKEGMVDEILRLCSFETLSNLKVNKIGKIAGTPFPNEAFFRKGKVGDGTNLLTSEMIERLDQITEEKCHGYGLIM